MEDIYSDSEVYHPLAVVGKGTFGEILKCWRVSDGELVALKASEAQWRNLNTNELRLAAALDPSEVDRSHIVCFFESFQHLSQQYLVLELLEKNLYELQRENGFRPLPVRHIRTISCQILRALAKLKDMAIIHADIKPENIMIVDQARFPFRVKLIDFGSACFFQEVRLVNEPYVQSRFYRAPEILLGLPFCEKVDMWSLGCVLAELYLGWPLFPGDSEFQQVRYICQTQGLPNQHLLNMATKTTLFFRHVQAPQGNLVWELRPAGGDEETSEWRKYVLRSLDEMYCVHGAEHEWGNEDAIEEAADRHHMVEFLKRMLAIDSHCRISPSAALRHPFIQLSHLQGTHYHSCSLQELQIALITQEPQIYRDCGEHSKAFPSELIYQEEAGSPCSAGDHHDDRKLSNQPCHEGMIAQEPSHYETCSEFLETHNTTLNQADADAGGQENASSCWTGDHMEFQTIYHPEHSLVNVPMLETASVPTYLNHTTQAVQQSMFCSFPFQVHTCTFPTPPPPGSLEDNPPQFFVVGTLSDHQELLAQGQITHQASWSLEQDVPDEADFYGPPSVQEGPIVDGLHFNTSFCSSTTESGDILTARN